MSHDHIVSRHGPDGYRRHLVAGAAIGLFTASVMQGLFSMPVAAVAAGIAAAASAAVVREVAERLDPDCVADWRGAAYITAGGFSAMLILLFR